MDSDKKTNEPEDQPKKDDLQAPADALSRTPEDLEQEAAERKEEAKASEPAAKKESAIKRFFSKINVYLLIFVLLLVVVGAVSAVRYLNNEKAAPKVDIESQGLTEDALKQLANTDASVGNTSQTLTIQGNAVIAGQTLMRGDLNVAGNFQAGGSLRVPSITISGDANLGNTQVRGLQVSDDLAIQGNTTMQNLNVAGTSSFNGAMTASQITVTRLILSGNAVLQVPNHISFTGPSPSRSINSGVLGGGGSASVNGSDTTGTVNINTGNGPAAGCFVRITFRQPFSNRPHVLISPVGQAAGRTQYYVDRDQSGFSICSSTPAPANQSFAFDYFVTN